jgi:hypothetical protein
MGLGLVELEDKRLGDGVYVAWFLPELARRAVMIFYNTPPVGLGCRTSSATILQLCPTLLT